MFQNGDFEFSHVATTPILRIYDGLPYPHTPDLFLIKMTAKDVL